MAVELTIPSAGESITEVQIGSWLKSEGDYVERDEAVVELETDKASMELPAPVTGVLMRIVKQAGEIVPVGSVIATIEPGDRPAQARPAPSAAAAPAPADKAAASRAGAAAVSAPPRGAAAASASGDADAGAGARQPAHVMPAAARALAEAGLSAADVEATGPGGRLLKEDVQRYMVRPAEASANEAPSPVPRRAAPQPDGFRQEEVVPMTMLRRRIAQRLVEAQNTAAMLTTFNEANLAEIQRLRKERGDDFEKKYGVKLGLMSFFVKAAIDALKRFPAVNAEIRGNDIVYKNYFDIGIAVSTDQGLVVPVVRNAERLSFAEVERAIADLAVRARERKITVEELQGGTFTITNGGIFGSLMATPIINPPQSAILGLHAIKDRPIAENGAVVIRPMMYLALTYDHRIIDGRESVGFLRRIKDCVEDPTRMLIEA